MCPESESLMNPNPHMAFQELGDSQLHGDFLGFQTRGCSAFYPESANWNAFEGQFQPSSVNGQLCYPPANWIYPFQDFQYFVVIDFEATCDKEKIPQPQEIIEFPSVIVNGMTGEIEGYFRTYVRPTVNQRLTEFCKDLTGIQQNQVDGGVTLDEALFNHDNWLHSMGIKRTNFAVVTWSNWDCQVMLESECQYKKILKPSYFNRWINLRVPFNKVFGGVRCNLKQAVEIAGLSWVGRAHCGLDDAKNTARLLSLLMHKGVKLSITDTLRQKNLGDRSFPDKKVKTLCPPCCYCGIICREWMGNSGSSFFGCGNWAADRGARCKFFQFVS